MSSRQFAVLACKLLGIFALLMALMMSSTVLWGSGLDLRYRVGSVLPFACLAAAGFWLLVFSEALGRLLTRGAADGESVTLNVTPEFGLVAIALIGLFDLLTSVPALISRAFFMLLRDEPELAIALGDYAPGLVASTLRVAFGLWLVLGARSMSNFLRKLRYIGLQPNERPWPDESGPADTGSDNSNEG